MHYCDVTRIQGQKTAVLLLPTSNQDDLFALMINIAFWGKLVHVLALIYDQSNIDIFFLDWEKPRSTSTQTSVRLVFVFGLVFVHLPSIWRTYFVANEWAELQSVRKLSTHITLFIVLFFLYVADLQSLTTTRPSGADGALRHIAQPYVHAWRHMQRRRLSPYLPLRCQRHTVLVDRSVSLLLFVIQHALRCHSLCLALAPRPLYR
jgi:meckelin